MYLNWAEYLTWENPRIKSYDQYLINDPLDRQTGSPAASKTYRGQAQADAGGVPDAALPAGLEHRQGPRRWSSGARSARRRTRPPRPTSRRSVQIQFRAGSGGAFKTVQRVKLTNAARLLRGPPDVPGPAARSGCAGRTRAGRRSSAGPLRSRCTTSCAPSSAQPRESRRFASGGRNFSSTGSCYRDHALHHSHQSPATPSRRSPPRRAIAVSLGAGAALPAVASASHKQIAIIQDNSDLVNAPAAMAQFRALGATTVRVFLPWATIAPNATADVGAQELQRHRPGRLQRRQVGAVRRDRPRRGAVRPDGRLRRRPAARRAGPRAPGSRQGERHQPVLRLEAERRRLRPVLPGGRQALRRAPTRPRASRRRCRGSTSGRSGTSRTSARTSARRRSTARASPTRRRCIATSSRSGWSALQQTGHGKDTILIGGFAAIGSDPHPPTSYWPQGLPGNAGQTHPIQFVRSLYCLNANTGAKLSGSRRRAGRLPGQRVGPRPGSARTTRACSTPPGSPTTRTRATATRPRAAVRTTPTFPDLDHLASTADAGARAWGGGRRYQIYNDEFGWITNPPNSNPKHAVRVAGDRRVLHQLGRVPELAQPDRRQLRPVPARRSSGALPVLERAGDLHAARRRRPTTPTGCRCTCPRRRSHAARR